MLKAEALSRTTWDVILTSKKADLSLENLAADGTLRAIFPALYKLVGFGGGDSGHKDLWDHTKRVVIQTPPQALLRWAALWHDCGKPLAFSRETGVVSFHHHEAISARVFRTSVEGSGLFTVDEISRVSSIIGLLGKVEQYEAEWTDAAVRRLSLELGDLAGATLAVARADCTTRNPTKRRHAHRRCHDLKARINSLKEQDATPNALPHGLGDAVMVRLGFQAATMTLAQRVEMGRVMQTLKSLVDAGELPRSGNIALYMERVEDLL